MRIFILFLVLPLLLFGCTSYEKENNQLKEEVRMLKEENNYLKAEIIGLKREITEVNRRVKEEKEHIRKELQEERDQMQKKLKEEREIMQKRLQEATRKKPVTVRREQKETNTRGAQPRANEIKKQLVPTPPENRNVLPASPESR